MISLSLSHCKLSSTFGQWCTYLKGSCRHFLKNSILFHEITSCLLNFFWTMDTEKLFRGFKIIQNFILVITVIFLTFLQLIKLLSESTTINISYDNEHFELPSISIFPGDIEYSTKLQKNITFQKYFESTLNPSEFFDVAIQEFKSGDNR